MRRLYLICLRVQYGVWLFCALAIAGVYVSSFFVDTLNVSWYLIPVALVVLPVSALLSLVIVGIFVYETVLTKGRDQADRPSLLSALPSMIFLIAASFLVRP
jgi:hypothetical protein